MCRLFGSDRLKSAYATTMMASGACRCVMNVPRRRHNGVRRGQQIADGALMKRTAQLLTYALVLTSGSAFADAITGAPAVASYSDAAQATQDRSSNASVAPAARGDEAQLFDASGASLLLMSPPQFLFVGAHGKLRGGDASASDGSGGSGGGSLIPGGVLNGLTSGVSPGTLSNVGFSAGGTPVEVTAAAAPIANPEPASLILLGSGLAFCARQLKRRRS